MKLIDELKAERVKRGLSQSTVAEAMGTTQSALSRAERSGGNPTQDFLQRYHNALQSIGTNGSVLEIATLKTIISAVACKYGIAEMYLYGSFARGEAHPDSDVDLLYVLEPGVQPGMMHMHDFRQELEQHLGREVSLISLRSLERHAQTSRASRRFYNHIQPDMVKVA